MPRRRTLSDADYTALLELRTGLRRFLRWSEQKAAEAGLTPMQHQLLLAVRGHPSPEAPTVSDLAEHLLLRHHSVVGLIDRAVEASLVTRQRDRDDQRVVRISLTTEGAASLESLSAEHLEELQRFTRKASSLATSTTPTDRSTVSTR